MRLDNLLVATDFSDLATPITRWALATARRFRSRITLLHVDEISGFQWPARTPEGSVRLQRLLQELAASREARLDEAAAAFRAQGIAVCVEAVEGRPADTILERCRAGDVDMLLIGKRGTRRKGPFALGSVARRVLRRVEVPTLIVPQVEEGVASGPEPFGNGRIIAANALSTACMMNVDATLELADALGAQVRCVHVVKLPVPFSVAPAAWPEIVAGESPEDLERLCARELAEQLGKERAGRCSAYSSIGVSVAGCLRDLALETEVDLITIPSHRGRKEHPPFFGSTTEGVVKRAPVPVLVMPLAYLEQHFGMAPAIPR